MSLSAWSYPFYDEQRPIEKRATSRKKITKMDHAKMDHAKMVDDDSSLADYSPPQPEPQEPAPEPPADFNRDGDLVEKLNYMIYLLEEKRDEKTGHVTEEIILYLFLGIFVIFLVDSFVKTGKYSR